MKKLELSKGHVALVDDEDFELAAAYSWYAYKPVPQSKTYYAARTAKVYGKQKTITLHRYLLGISDPRVLVDHKDGNGLNCQRYNMRASTRSQNSHNRHKRRDSQNPYKGVRHLGRKWSSDICVDGVKIFLGMYSSAEKAAKAYNKAAKRYLGEFANLNKISESPKTK